jgi:hypothetical protein
VLGERIDADARPSLELEQSGVGSNGAVARADVEKEAGGLAGKHGFSEPLVLTDFGEERRRPAELSGAQDQIARRRHQAARAVLLEVGNERPSPPIPACGQRRDHYEQERSFPRHGRIRTSCVEGSVRDTMTASEQIGAILRGPWRASSGIRPKRVRAD